MKRDRTGSCCVEPVRDGERVRGEDEPGFLLRRQAAGLGQVDPAVLALEGLHDGDQRPSHGEPRAVEGVHQLGPACVRVAPARLHAPRLEVAAADPRHIREAASLGLNALMQRWRDHPRVDTRWVDRLSVDGKEQISIMLDGEPQHLDAPATFEIRPEAVRFLAAD